MAVVVTVKSPTYRDVCATRFCPALPATFTLKRYADGAAVYRSRVTTWMRLNEWMNERNSRCRRCRNTRLPKETKTEVSFCGTSWENDRFIGTIVGRETLALARTIARESNGAEPGSKLKFLFSFVCTNNNNEITCASRHADRYTDTDSAN